MKPLFLTLQFSFGTTTAEHLWRIFSPCCPLSPHWCLGSVGKNTLWLQNELNFKQSILWWCQLQQLECDLSCSATFKQLWANFRTHNQRQEVCGTGFTSSRKPVHWFYILTDFALNMRVFSSHRHNEHEQSSMQLLINSTWKRRMMVQMRPRVRRWFPSTMSCEPMFSRCTFCSLRNCRALSTFSRQWIRMRPLVGRGCEKQKKKKSIALKFIERKGNCAPK